MSSLYHQADFRRCSTSWGIEGLTLSFWILRRIARALPLMLRGCRSFLVPCQPSIMDLRAMRKTTDLLKHIRKPASAVLNGVWVQGSAALGTEKAIAAEFKSIPALSAWVTVLPTADA